MAATIWLPIVVIGAVPVCHTTQHTTPQHLKRRLFFFRGTPRFLAPTTGRGPAANRPPRGAYVIHILRPFEAGKFDKAECQHLPTREIIPAVTPAPGLRRMVYKKRNDDVWQFR